MHHFGMSAMHGRRWRASSKRVLIHLKREKRKKDFGFSFVGVGFSEGQKCTNIVRPPKSSMAIQRSRDLLDVPSPGRKYT